MFHYIFVFIISFLCSVISEKAYKNKKKIIFYIFACAAILIPSIMAGLRASGIGTDTHVYIDRIFECMVQSKNLKDILYYKSYSDVELFYFLFNFLVSRVSTSLTAIYFSCSLIVNGLFFVTFFYYYKKFKISYSYSYILLLLLFFNKSLNMNRQMIAMSICFFSTIFIVDKKIIKYIITIYIASLFHNSAILFLPVYYFYYITQNKSKKNFLKQIAIISGIVAVVILMKPTLNILIDIGILKEKYLNYSMDYGMSSNIKIIEWLPKVIIIFFILMFNNKLIKECSINRWFIFMFFVECATFLLGFSSMYAQRISYYYEVFLCVLVPQTHFIVNKKRDKLIVFFIVISSFIIFSYLYYEHFDFDQTIPYVIDTNK